jgi:hypothetical protein
MLREEPVSTLNVRDADDGSTFPAGSVARTWKTWGPSASASVVCGELQEANDPLSTRHSKLEPASEEKKLNLGVGSLVVHTGPEPMYVRGGKDSATLRTRWLLESAM